MKTSIKMLFLIFGILFSSACRGEIDSPIPEISISPIQNKQTHTTTPGPTATLTPTLSETSPPPTATIAPTDTHTLTPTATTSPSSTPTATAETLEEVVKHLDTPEKLSEFLLKHIEFSDHGGCISYWPDIFYQKRQGNCKDFATFASYVLGKNGYKAQRVTYVFYNKGVRYGHDVATYEMNGALWIMSNGEIRGPFTSLSDYFDSLYWLDYVTLLCIKPPGGVSCCRP